MALVPGLVPRVFRLLRAVSSLKLHEQVLLEDELLSRVVGGGVDAGIHADRVAGAGFDAEAAEDAAQLVDDEALREALVAAARIAFGVLAGFDVDALRGARRRAAEARDATRGAVVAVREAVHAPKAGRIGPPLLGVRHGVDALLDRFGRGVVALAEDHLLRVLEEVAHRDAETTSDFGNVRLNGRGALG